MGLKKPQNLHETLNCMDISGSTDPAGRLQSQAVISVKSSMCTRLSLAFAYLVTCIAGEDVPSISVGAKE